MNFAEIKQLAEQSKAIGINTVRDLEAFKIKKGCKCNNDLVNAVNAAYCKQEVQ